MYRITNVKNGEYLEFESYNALINELSRYNFINYITNRYGNTILGLVGINNSDKTVYVCGVVDKWFERCDKDRHLRITYDGNNIYDSKLKSDVFNFGLKNLFTCVDTPIIYRGNTIHDDFVKKNIIRRVLLSTDKVGYNFLGYARLNSIVSTKNKASATKFRVDPIPKTGINYYKFNWVRHPHYIGNLRRLNTDEYREFTRDKAIPRNIHDTKHLEKNWKRNNKCRKQWECAVKRRSKHMYTEDIQSFNDYIHGEIQDDCI